MNETHLNEQLSAMGAALLNEGSIRCYRLPDYEAVSQAGKLIFDITARQAIQDRGRFITAIQGGKTPKRMFELLRDSDFWPETHVFFGDEHPPRRDMTQTYHEFAHEHLLQHVESAQVHPLRLADSEAQRRDEVKRYSNQLKHVLGEDLSLDLIGFGVASDLHTLSIYSGSMVFDSSELVEVLPREDTRYTYTLTPLLVRRSKRGLFMLTGEDKTSILEEILAGSKPARDFPPALAGELRGTTYLLTDIHS